MERSTAKPYMSVGLLAHVSASRGVPHKSPLNVPQFAIQAAIKDGRN